MRTVADLMNLDGRRALVTGSTGGIGRLIAETLSELGSELILVDRPGSDFSGFEKNFQNIGQVKTTNFECNLEDANQRRELLDFINDLTSLDILVNNAAFVGESNLDGWVTSFQEQSLETWRRVIEVNLTAPFELCKGCAPLLGKDPGGSIINIASIYGLSGPDYTLYKGTDMGNPAAYAASKGGLIQFTRWLSTTLAPQIRVNAISPGGVFRNQPESFVEKYESRTPLGRMANEEDIKGAIAYLSTDLSAYVTGHNLLVDGGWTV